MNGKNKTLCLCISFCLVSFSSIAAYADGKFFAVDVFPPEVPYQRAIIMFDDANETLILQSSYKISEANNVNSVKDVNSIGWVVPVPAIPELASMNSEGAFLLTLRFEMWARPNVIHISNTLGLILMSFFFGLFAFKLYSCFKVPLWPIKDWFKLNSKILRFSFLYLFISMFFSCFAMPAMHMAGVDLLKEQQVGIYNVRVVKSNTPSELINWLNSNKFKFTDTDKELFQSYIDKGWVFVVANTNIPKNDEKIHISHGMADPLMLRFPVKTPVYPLALTSSVGKDTEVMIYLLSKSKMTCNDRLRLKYAGNYSFKMIFDDLIFFADPNTFFNVDNSNYKYLCKFKGTMTPSEMKTDLEFKPAMDNKPHRETIIKF